MPRVKSLIKIKFQQYPHSKAHRIGIAGIDPPAHIVFQPAKISFEGFLEAEQITRSPVIDIRKKFVYLADSLFIIRDIADDHAMQIHLVKILVRKLAYKFLIISRLYQFFSICLLYTSDAADEL